jgi:hypothetical protein
VIVVKEGNKMDKLETLVVATNFRRESGAKFKKVEEISEILNLQLKVLF